MNKAHKKAMKSFRKFILSKAIIARSENVKLGNIGSWMMLMGNIEWYIPSLNMTIKGTCGNHCEGCFDKENPKKSDCYAVKSYVINTAKNNDGSVGDIISGECSVKTGHAYRTIAMTMYRDELLLSLDKQLTRMQKPMDIIRINVSGELTCYSDLALWCELGRRHPERIFYLYTKNYNAVREAIANDVIPSNVWINISIWHQIGIKAYKEMKDHKQIRAFCLVDNDWTKEKYATNGIEIDSMCGAYDEKGKMNHAVTCDKCRKCFSSTSKCVGCFSH